MENEGQQQPPAQPPAPQQPPQQQPPQQPPAVQRPPVQVNTGPDLTELVTKIQAMPEQILNSVREAFPPAAPPASPPGGQGSGTSGGQGSGQSSAPPVSQVPPAASAGTPPKPLTFGDKFRKAWFGR